MKRLRRTVAAGALSVLAAAPLAAQVPRRTTVEIKTPLNLLGPRGSFVVLANETGADAGGTAITVVFHDAHDRVIKRVELEYAAGRPAVVGLRRAEVPGREPFAAFWVEVSLSRPGDFSPSTGAVAFKAVDGSGDVGCPGACHTCPRDVDGGDVSCAPPEGGRQPEFSCPDGSAYVSRITLER